MYNALLGLALLLLGTQVSATPLEITEKTVLVYKNVTSENESQFVLRVARFQPDIFLEWESLSHQGTVHMFRKAVESSKRITIGALFEPGVDIESKDQVTKWLSREIFQELVKSGEAKIEINRISTSLSHLGEEEYSLRVNGEESSVSAIVVEDSRNGKWLFYNEESNPLLLEFSNPYYREYLSSISESNTRGLRWIKSLPPVK